jgi:16S rRNA (guanine966-N2)-methyltransferase
MRIIGGEAKGRTLHFPPESKERPTSDFLREALFNILGPLQDNSFIDLFAGSGSVGIEAASRGAADVVLVEKNKKIASVIQKNIESCGFKDQCRLLNLDVENALRELNNKKRSFDIIFADPPYDKGLAEETIKLLNKYPIFAADVRIVIQHSVKEDFNAQIGGRLILQDQRKYGSNVLTFLKMECL